MTANYMNEDKHSWFDNTLAAAFKKSKAFGLIFGAMFTTMQFGGVKSAFTPVIMGEPRDFYSIPLFIVAVLMVVFGGLAAGQTISIKSTPNE